MNLEHAWTPDEEVITSSNIYRMMEIQNLKSFEEFYHWSIANPEMFWRDTMDLLEIKLMKRYIRLLDVTDGAQKASWLHGAEMNIVDSCFRNWGSAPAIVFQQESGDVTICSHRGLQDLVNKVANSLVAMGLEKGDRIAICMPMTINAVAVYLGIIKAGMVAVTIADSFSAKEIKVRLDLTQPKLILTKNKFKRQGKEIELYQRLKEADSPPAVIIPLIEADIELRSGDQMWEDFLSDDTFFESVACAPHDPITILFSSGTTGTPKAIPWDHTTPIKSAADGMYHQNIQNGDIVCWPTNLGWMMGPWLVFASLINEAAIALYEGAPLGKDFGQFVQNAAVTMLGVVPSLVAHWKSTGCMEGLNWSAIKNFSSTGEVSNPEDMLYLMNLANNKPVIEYCGGTEIGGGYVSGTVIQPAIPGTFTTAAFGSSFLLLDERNKEVDQGEVFLIPPAMGLSRELLNKDHDEVYYKGAPIFDEMITRKHGDQLKRLPNGYFRAMGRVDDTMNLGGIKVSAVEIEELVQSLAFITESAAVSVEPEDGGPSQLIVYAVGSEVSDGLPTVRNLIKEQLNPLFKIQDLVWVDSLPRTASNKIMRRKLRELYLTSQKV